LVAKKTDNFSNIMKVKTILLKWLPNVLEMHSTSQCLKPGQQDETGKSRKYKMLEHT